MPRMVPSRVRDAIARVHPGVLREGGLQVGAIAALGRSLVQAVVDLVEQIPTELIALPADDYSAYSVAVSVARLSISAQAPGHNADQAAMPVLGMFGGRTALRVIYDALALCPDQAATAQTAGLEFIKDDALREELRRDISASTGALMSHDYKAATVLAGSVVEALLLWALGTVGEPAVRANCAQLNLPRRGLEFWALGDFIAAASECALIEANTKTQAELAQDFRNLIHPGRAQRLNAACTLGTAYAALAAVDAVCTDFAKRKWL